MRISPEPLHPLRNWRELWQPEPLMLDQGLRDRSGNQPANWKQPKRCGFHWLSHLFSREIGR
jgi:hypothetical protein